MGCETEDQFEQFTRDILDDPLFQETRSFVHHGEENSVYDHSVATARMAYRLAKRFGIDGQALCSITRAALLHDFFGYDWHGDWFKGYLSQYSGWQRLRHMHAFIHGEIAAERAGHYFSLTRRECDAIASHMFPLSTRLPRTREAWILTLADKIVASREMTRAAGYYVSAFYQKLFTA